MFYLSISLKLLLLMWHFSEICYFSRVDSYSLFIHLPINSPVICKRLFIPDHSCSIRPVNFQFQNWPYRQLSDQACLVPGES